MKVLEIKPGNSSCSADHSAGQELLDVPLNKDDVPYKEVVPDKRLSG